METILARKKSIESEFDEPMRNVITGFIAMGHSLPIIAETLDVSFYSLRWYCRQRRITVPRSPKVHREGSGRPPRLITHNGRTNSITGWANELGVAPGSIAYRLKKNQPIDRL